MASIFTFVHGIKQQMSERNLELYKMQEGFFKQAIDARNFRSVCGTLDQFVGSNFFAPLLDLFKSTVDINAKDDYGRTVFYYFRTPALGTALVDCVKAHDGNPSDFINAQDIHGHTPLIAASSDGRHEAIKFLLDNGADINVKDNEGETIFYHIHDIKTGQILVDWMTPHDTQPASLINEHSKRGYTALTRFAESRPEIADFLLANGADVNLQDKDGNTQLITAANNGWSNAVTFLLNHNTNINAKDKDGKTIFHRLTRPCPALIDWIKINQNEKLLDYINARDNDGNTPLILMTKCNCHPEIKKEVVIFLLDHGADIGKKDKTGKILFHYINGSDTDVFGVALIEWLNKNNPTKIVDYVNTSDNDGNTPLSVRRMRMDGKAMTFLLACTEYSRVSKFGDEWAKLLSKAPVKKEQLKEYSFYEDKIKTQIQSHSFSLVFKTLKELKGSIFFEPILDFIKRIIDINAKSDDGTTPLIAAAHNGINEAVEFLVNRGADVNAQNNDGWTPLLAAAIAKMPVVIKFLLDHGADINAKGENETTVFFYIKTKGSATVLIDWIKEKDPSKIVDYVNARDLDGNTPLIFAASSGDVEEEAIKVLLDNGADINAKNRSGRTAFHYAKNTSFWIEAIKKSNILQNASSIDEYNRTPFYCALEDDKSLLADAFEKENAPLFGRNREGQLVFPFSTGNPKILVRALFEAERRISEMDALTQKRILGEILLPSMLFQRSSCLPLIAQAKKMEVTSRLCSQFMPKRIAQFFMEAPAISPIHSHHLAIFIDKDGEFDGARAVSIDLAKVLEKESVPCLIVGDHLLRNACKILEGKKVAFENKFYFFVSDHAEANFSAYLIIPKKYLKIYAPEITVDLENLSWLASLGFLPNVLECKEFKEIAFDKIHDYRDLSWDKFGNKTVNVIKEVLLDAQERGRIVYVQGHGWSYLRQKFSEHDAIAVNLPLDSFVHLIKVLEDRGTIFTHVLTCLLGADNLNVLEKFMARDLFNTSVAKIINLHHKTSEKGQAAREKIFKKNSNKMFLSIASTADISTSGGVDVDCFFPAIDTFFGLLKSEAVKDVMPNIYIWLNRMFRTVGVTKDLVNYPQVRIPGNDTQFYLTDIHGDLQIINRLSAVQDRLSVTERGEKILAKEIPSDIRVLDKNILVTYVDKVINKIIIEGRLPVILAMGTNEYFRSFREIEIRMPDVDFFTFGYNCFYKGEFGEEMGHRETYLIETLCFNKADIFEDIALPQELQGQTTQILYNVLIKRGLEGSAYVVFSLNQDPEADIFRITEKHIVKKFKADEQLKIRTEINAIRAGQELSFDASELQLVTKPNTFIRQYKGALATVLPDTIKSFLIKSVIMGGKNSEKLLHLYLKLLENEKIRPHIEKLFEFVVEKYKEISAWTRFEKMKMVVFSFPEKSTLVKENLNKLIDALFVFDKKNQDELKKYCNPATDEDYEKYMKEKTEKTESDI